MKNNQINKLINNVNLSEINDFMFNVKFKHTGGLIPKKATPYSAGYDIGIRDWFYDQKNKLFKCYTGIYIEPPIGFYCTLHERSSLYKYGFKLQNSVGVIDQDYRGEIIALISRNDNIDTLNLDLQKPYFQLIFHRHYNPHMIEVNDVNETKRGNGGFGSTS